MAAQVEFHTGVADPVGFACRLLRKAWQTRVRVLLMAPAETLTALDQALWTFDAHGFVPHVRLAGASPSVAARTPIWLATEVPSGERPSVLVNLGAAPPVRDVDFERVIEVVGTDDASRRAGRQRWRHYEAWGVRPLHHGGGT